MLKIGLLVISVIITSSQLIAKVNGNNAGNTSSLIQQYLNPQPSRLRAVCNLLTRFQISNQNGSIEVTCLKNRSMIGEVLQNRFHLSEQILSTQKHYGLQVKLEAYFARDGMVALCRLNCSRGKPSPRRRTLPPFGSFEPNEVNVGCDDWKNMKCADTCPSSMTNVWNGQVECTRDAFFGSRCRVRCHENFAPRGPQERICGPNSTWLPQTPFLCEGFCPVSPVEVPNGEVECTDSLYAGSLCTLRCHRGYRPRGVTKKICAHHSWIPQMPFACEEEFSCDPSALTLENGYFNCTRDNSVFSKCQAMCYEGYDAVGPTQQICLPTGNTTAAWYVASERNSLSSSSLETRCVASSEIYSAVEKSLPTEGRAVLRRFNAKTCNFPQRDRIPCPNCENARQCVSRKCCWDRSRTSRIRCYRPLIRRYSPRGVQIPTNPAQNIMEPKGNTLFGILQSHSSASERSTFPPECTCTSTRPRLRTCSYAFPIPSTTVEAPTPYGTQIVLQPSVGARYKSLDMERLSMQRVYRGYDASANDWPWHVILDFDSVLCGGTLISDRFVITAAHCITREDDSVVESGMLVFGATNMSDDRNVQERAAMRVVRHQNFSSTSDVHSRNDLAIIMLDSPVGFAPNIKPLCLPRNKEAIITDECYVTGFGKVSGSGPASQILQQACVPLVSRSECKRYYGNYLMPYQHLCAGGGGSNAPDTCRGDSGGPLVCRRRGSGNCGWYLAGVTSFGQSPCGSGSPSVYMNVFHYQQWIYTTIRQLEEGSLSQSLT